MGQWCYTQWGANIHANKVGRPRDKLENLQALGISI